MRKVVAYEGRETRDGRTLLPHCLQAADEIPVVVWAPGTSTVIGVARDMQRSEFGEVSFELELEDDRFIEGMTANIFITDIKVAWIKTLEYFTHAVIKEILLREGPNAWGER